MKKIIIFLSLVFISCFWSVRKYEARSFNEELNSNYMFYLYKPDASRFTKSLLKVSDEYNKIYFNVSPYAQNVFSKDDYVETKTNLDLETLEKLSKIIYFGSKYHDISDDYYFATQYLIYEVFDIPIISYIIITGSELVDNAIIDIQSNIENIKFSLTDFTTNENVYMITDRYIVDNFMVEGDNLDVSYNNDNITINFLDELESYQLHFVPKNNCQDITVWESEDIKLLNMPSVCEKDYTTAVEYVNENNRYTENIELDKETVDFQPNFDETKKIEEIVEVHVPNTSKYNYSLLGILLLLGNLYYVFKK